MAEKELFRNVRLGLSRARGRRAGHVQAVSNEESAKNSLPSTLRKRERTAKLDWRDKTACGLHDYVPKFAKEKFATGNDYQTLPSLLVITAIFLESG